MSYSQPASLANAILGGVVSWRSDVKAPSIFLLALLGVLTVSGGRAEAHYISFGYRANNPVIVSRAYRGPAWDYTAPYLDFRASYHRRACNRYRCRR
jgi:hypothetical protein